MKKCSVLFVCLGNICRSPMAEYLFLDLLKKEGLQRHISVSSAATSTWEIGNPPHAGTQKVLADLGISCKQKRAIHLQKEDYNRYDYIIGMDMQNIDDMLRLFGSDEQHKVRLLLSFVGEERDIKDPWYTGNFDVTRDDIQNGLLGLLSDIENRF